MVSIKEVICKRIPEASNAALVGIGFKNLRTNEEFYFNGDKIFPTASVFKILVLVELFNQKIKGQIDLNEKYLYNTDEISLGSGVLRELFQPIEISYRDYAKLMMIISDNTASDVLLSKVGRFNVKRTIEKLGLKNTKINLSCSELILSMYGVVESDSLEIIQEKLKQKKVERNCNILVNYNIENNVTTPRDMVELLSKIYNTEILNNESCVEILNIMKSCQTNSRIPRYIPKNICIAHKTGTLDKIANDVGIVYTTKTDYILAVFYNGNMADDENYELNVKGAMGDNFIADISKDIFNYLKFEKNLN